MTPPRTPVRVVIVDDHPVVREGLAARIAQWTDFEVCGEAATTQEAIRLVAEAEPDVAIVDVALEDKGGDGLELVKYIRTNHPEVKCLVHSIYDDVLYAQRSLEAGALGYLNKHAARETMREALRRVAAGQVYVSPEMTDRILRSHAGHGPDARSVFERLSDRELQVLRLLGQGHGTRKVAEQLHLSVHTIETYREKLKAKLDLANGAELARFAAQWVLENA